MNAIVETNGNMSSSSNTANYNVTVDTTGNNKDLLVNGIITMTMSLGWALTPMQMRG